MIIIKQEQFELLITEVTACLDHGQCIAALYIALTLPDICGKAEYPEEQRNKDRYLKWYNTFIEPYELPPVSNDDEELLPYLSGEVVYSLRNQILHQGTPTVDLNKITDQRNLTDKFTLIIEDKNTFNLYGSTSSIHKDNTGNLYREHTVSVRNLCMKLSSTALGYYKDNKDKFNFLNVEFVDQR